MPQGPLIYTGRVAFKCKLVLPLTPLQGVKRHLQYEGDENISQTLVGPIFILNYSLMVLRPQISFQISKDIKEKKIQS